MAGSVGYPSLTPTGGRHHRGTRDPPRRHAGVRRCPAARRGRPARGPDERVRAGHGPGNRPRLPDHDRRDAARSGAGGERPAARRGGGPPGERGHRHPGRAGRVGRPQTRGGPRFRRLVATGREPRRTRRVGLHGRVPAGRDGSAGRPGGHHPLALRRGPGPRAPRRGRPARRHPPAAGPDLDLRRGDRGHRSGPRAGRGRPRRGRGTAGGPRAGRVPAQARRAEPVRRSGVVRAGATAVGPCRPGPHPRRPGGRPARPRAGRASRHERAALQPRVHPVAGRPARRLRRAGPGRRRPQAVGVGTGPGGRGRRPDRLRFRETMRRAFLRRVGVAPDHYRRHFATTERT